MSVLDVLLKPQLLVGLDIGTSSIKMARLKETGKGIELLSFDYQTLPPDAVVDGAIKNRQAVVEKIRLLADICRCAGAKCALTIGGYSFIEKNILIPEMTEEELAESVVWEAESYIPFDIKDVNVDAQILNLKSGQGTMDVLLIAAKKDVVNDYVTAAREAGLFPAVVDTSAFACQNAFALNYGFSPNELIALINIGASTMDVNVVSNGISVFQRHISMGGALVTEEIMKTLDISWEEAEHYKTMPEDTVSSSAVFREVQKLHERVTETLVTEIQRSLDFFAAITINADMARIYLSGGASQNPAFARAMERRFKVPVELVNPFKNIIIDSQKFDLDLLMRTMAPIGAVAIGLARRFERDKAKGAGDVRINLIGEKRKAPSLIRRKIFYFPRPPWSVSVRVPMTKKRCTLTLSVD